MAGYIMNLDSVESLEIIMKSGIYSTNLSQPNNERWLPHHEGTYADYITMREGDSIFFFIGRKIYGIGELINIKGECKLNNFLGASYPKAYKYKEIKTTLLWDRGKGSENLRWLCVFKPSPKFFRKGVDMDEVLASNPNSFKMLRAFWKRSFIKIDDDENQALLDVVLRKNEEYIISADSEYIFTFDKSYHIAIEKRVSDSYLMDLNGILDACSQGNFIKHEMAIEASILHQLTKRIDSTIEIFGTWDYLSHQVIASPFKPIDYMDKIDIFGYRYIESFTTKSKFLVAELKKDDATEEHIEQVMKYIDWVTEEYAYGDYSMTEGFLVAYDFNENVIDFAKKVARRIYTIGSHPATTKTWNCLKLIKYRYDKGYTNLTEICY